MAAEVGCMELPEDRQWTFNQISAPASLDKPKHYTPPFEFRRALLALAEHGLIG